MLNLRPFNTQSFWLWFVSYVKKSVKAIITTEIPRNKPYLKKTSVGLNCRDR